MKRASLKYEEREIGKAPISMKHRTVGAGMRGIVVATLHCLLVLMSITGCASLTPIPIRPRSPAEVLLPESGYHTEIEKSLNKTYQANLLSVYSSVRILYAPIDVEFLEGEGIGFFRNPAGGEKSYLGIKVGTDNTYNTLRTNYNQRAATVFNKYGQSLIRILLVEKAVLEDERVEGVAITLRWLAKNFMYEDYIVAPTIESMSLYAGKKDCEEFIGLRMSNQEFVEKSVVLGNSGNTDSGRIELDLQQSL